MNLTPQVGFFELVVIAVIALIVVGPKDLPRLLRTFGQWMGKAQRLANEFRRGLDQMAKESGVDDVKRQVEAVASLHPANQVKKAVLGTGAATPTPKVAEAAKPAPLATPTADVTAEPPRATGTS